MAITIVHDWKYNIKSALITFCSVFIPLLAIQIHGLNLHEALLSFYTGGIIVAIRTFLRLIFVPICEATWEALKTCLDLLSNKIQNK